MSTPTTAPKLNYPKRNLTDLAKQVDQLATPAPRSTATTEAAADVRATTDYDIFTTIASNRPIVEPHVRHLMEQITEKDMLHLRPIDVNDAMGVVDGQHRLEAARRLGRPIYYRVAQLTEEDMAALNRASRNWKNTDYLHYWASKGRPDYVKLVEFMQRHPQFIMSSAQALLSPIQARYAEDFREGRYLVDDEARAEVAATFLVSVKEQARFKYAYDVRFTAAIMRCYTHVMGFEPATLLRKILLQPTELVRCATLQQYLDLFERLYNYKTTEKLQVRFR